MKYRVCLLIAFAFLASCTDSKSLSNRLVTVQCEGKDAPEVLVRNSLASLSVRSSVKFTGNASLVNGNIEFVDKKGGGRAHISFPDIEGEGVLVAEIITTSGKTKMKTFTCNISNGLN